VFPKFSRPKYRSVLGALPSIAFSSFVDEFPCEGKIRGRERRSGDGNKNRRSQRT
jgi:hypothetical protein